MNRKILEQTNEYYSEKIREFGKTSRGVDWNSEESQCARFVQLSRILSKETGKDRFSICDYGCGYGSYFKYLKENGYTFDYTGIDISDQMISCAEESYDGQEHVNFIKGAEIEREYDYIIASGIFNVRQGVNDEEWTRYMIEILEKFHRHSRKGFSFNCLTKYSDAEFMRDDLYYADPLFYFDYCKRNFSRNVALLHDYELYEFTILVRK